MKYVPVVIGVLPAWLQNIVIPIYIYLIGIYFCIYEFIYDERWRKLFSGKLFSERYEPDHQLAEFRGMMSHWRTHESAGKTYAVVTGASGTIGIEIVKLLASLDIFVIGVDKRQPPSVESSDQIIHIPCDLNNNKEIEFVLATIKQKTDHVELFVAASGAIYIPKLDNMTHRDQFGQIYDNFIPTHMAANFGGNAQLFLGLSEVMRNSKWTRAKAVFLTSGVSRAARRWAQIVDNKNPAQNNLTAYADSKLVANLFAMFIARVQRDSKVEYVDIRAVHPGVVAGSLYDGAFPLVRFIINNILGVFLRSGQSAAKRVVELIFCENDDANGSYYEISDTPMVVHCDQKLTDERMTEMLQLVGLDDKFWSPELSTKQL